MIKLRMANLRKVEDFKYKNLECYYDEKNAKWYCHETDSDRWYCYQSDGWRNYAVEVKY